MPEVFSNGMTAASLLVARAMAALFPWQNYSSIVDVGSAQGCLPVEIARGHRHLAVGGFDLPHLRQPFESFFRKNGLADRIQFHAGDFLSDPPAPCRRHCVWKSPAQLGLEHEKDAAGEGLRCN